MTARYRAILILFCLAVLSGCASTRVTQQTSAASPQFARPNQILVYDFITDPARIPTDSPLRDDLSAPITALTSEELEGGADLAPSSPKAWLRISRPWVFPQCKPVREQRRKLATG